MSYRSRAESSGGFRYQGEQRRFFAFSVDSIAEIPDALAACSPFDPAKTEAGGDFSRTIVKIRNFRRGSDVTPLMIR